MKQATRAPFYACMYHGLCDTAREHGYALAIHGSVTDDLDLVAIPWVENASSADTLADALRRHVGAVVGGCVTCPKELLEQGAEQKPHGRLAWNLYMDHGAKVDLSIVPRLAHSEIAEREDPGRDEEAYVAAHEAHMRKWSIYPSYRRLWWMALQYARTGRVVHSAPNPM